jgi:ankyrin repeat protein
MRISVALLTVLLSKASASLSTDEIPSVDDFVEAASKGDMAFIDSSFSKGAQVDGYNGDGYTALMKAAGTGNIGLVEWLVDKGASVHAVSPRESFTPLMFAALNGFEAVVRFMIQHGAVVDYSDFHSWTALMYAIDRGYEL